MENVPAWLLLRTQSFWTNPFPSCLEQFTIQYRQVKQLAIGSCSKILMMMMMMMMMMMLMIMMMMNCYYCMVDRRKTFSLISNRDHCQRSSPSCISNMPRAGPEPALNLSLGLVEWNCAVVITTTVRCYKKLIKK